MPSNLRTCEDCRCKVAPQYFRNSSVCRLCVFKNRQQQQSQEISDLKEKCNSLQEECNSLKDLRVKYDALLEFVSANVGTIPPSLGQTRSQNSVSPPNSYADILLSPRPASQGNSQPASQDISRPASQVNSLPASQVNSRPASQENSRPASQENSRPASQENSRPASQVNSRPASQDNEFQPVRNGAKPPRKVPELEDPITYNSFQVLAEIKEDEFETRLVGDSMIKGQLKEFCGRSSNGRRKRYSYSGGTLDHMIDVCDLVTDKADDNTVVIIHAGTNDVHTTRSEELLEKYRRLIKRYKEKISDKNIVISGILPRTKDTRKGKERKQISNRFYNVAFSTNNRLKNLCTEENVNFVNFWDNFYYDSDLFCPDGLHLNELGSARFGRLLCNELSALRAKNDPSAPQPIPP